MNLHVGTHSVKDPSVRAELDANKGSINDRDGMGRTHFLAACFAKNWELAEYYIDHGADVQAHDKVLLMKDISFNVDLTLHFCSVWRNRNHIYVYGEKI